MSGIDRLLDGLPRWALVGGKGGVGKTTCAAALAERSAARGERVLLISTDPASTLGEAMGCALDASPKPVAGRSGLFACQLDAAAARTEFLARWRDTLMLIVDRGTYLDTEDLAGFIDSAIPGADEAMAVLTMGAMAADEQWDRVIVDTAPTGHTLRLLALPDTFQALVRLLERMQEKHRFMVAALTRRYRSDAADEFLDEMKLQVSEIRDSLRDPARAALVLVARPEPVVAAETVRYVAALRELGVHVAALVINAVPAEPRDAERRALVQLGELDTEIPRYSVPFRTPEVGLESIVAWGKALQFAEASMLSDTPARAPHAALQSNAKSVSSNDAVSILNISWPPLAIIGGKGGVGKTSAACAIAIAAAESGNRVLLVSTDPAPSIADALSQPIGDEETAVKGVDGLVALQIDAAASFERLRDRYRDRVDSLFDGLVQGGLDASHDRGIIRDLLSLAPPGIDEIYALSLLGEALWEKRYDRIIVDPAPTGHLLRLLEMPALALDWSHRILRMMLKYKELTGLGDSAQELLGFAKRTRALGLELADPSRSGVFVVALDEPLVRGETLRLVGAVEDRGIAVVGVLWNRADSQPAPLPHARVLPQFVSGTMVPPPQGTDALRRWLSCWTPLSVS